MNTPDQNKTCGTLPPLPQDVRASKVLIARLRIQQGSLDNDRIDIACARLADDLRKLAS